MTTYEPDKVRATFTTPDGRVIDLQGCDFGYLSMDVENDTYTERHDAEQALSALFTMTLEQTSPNNETLTALWNLALRADQRTTRKARRVRHLRLRKKRGWR